MHRIIVVGASAGGLSVAEALRRAGHEGTITLVGDEPRMPNDRPPLSKQLLAGQWTPSRLALRAWRALIATRTPWTAALNDATAA